MIWYDKNVYRVVASFHLLTRQKLLAPSVGGVRTNFVHGP